MDNTSINMFVTRPFLIILLGLASVGRSLALGIAFEPQDAESLFRNLSGPLGVLFGELLTILALAKVLQIIYKQKEKLQSQQISDRDATITELRNEKKQLMEVIKEMSEGGK